MPTTFSSSRILQPVRPLFIGFSLFVALLVNFLPTSPLPWLPDWVALVIVFWCIREPRHVGMGTGFVFGVAMDVADSGVLGQHALAYVLAAYAAGWLSRRIMWFPISQQALHVLPILLIVQIVQFAVRVVPGVDFPGLLYFVGPFIGAVLWWPLSFVLLLPQYQPVERDDNRPI